MTTNCISWAVHVQKAQHVNTFNGQTTEALKKDIMILGMLLQVLLFKSINERESVGSLNLQITL